ncbi:hypothetical protein [Streptomyces luteogriseus]|uniref:hypothetical protein n=1 Tax=Streptomyces luteogriseus TaxID=68233 RepID=UPI003796134F
MAGGLGNAEFDAIGQHFAGKFYRVAADAGFETTADPFDHDLEPFGAVGHLVAGSVEGRKAPGLEIQELLVAASVFVGTGVASWVVGKVCDAVWGRLQHAVGGLVQSVQERLATPETQSQSFPAEPQRVRIVFATLYAHDPLLVEVELDLGRAFAADRSFDAAAVSGLVADLQRRGALEGSGGQVVRYRCRDGVVPSEPEVTQLDVD